MSHQAEYEKVLKFFNGDKERTRLWYRTDNLLLGGISPNRMMELGRDYKLTAYINEALSG